MSGFKDEEGRHWDPRVTTRTLLRLRQETGVSLFRELGKVADRIRGGLEEGDAKVEEEVQEEASKAFAELFRDEAILYKLLFLSVDEVAKERKVTEDDLLDSLSTNFLMMEAVASIQEAVSNFFLKGRPQAEAEEPEEAPSGLGPGS